MQFTKIMLHLSEPLSKPKNKFLLNIIIFNKNWKLFIIFRKNLNKIKTNDKSAGDIASSFQNVLQTQNCIQSLGCNVGVGSVQYLGGTEV